MTIEIRTIRDDELAPFVDTVTTGFLERLPVDRIVESVRPTWDLARTWAAFDGDRPCGTFRSWATELTVPGGARLAAGAVVGVSVLPTHRRRGIMRAMTRAAHHGMRERGEVLGLLHSAEYPIYGRFGYGPATREATWTLDTHAASFVEEPVGRIEILRPDPAAGDIAKGVFETMRLREVAGLRRRDGWWDDELGIVPNVWGEDWKGFFAVHEDPAGHVDGYVRYTRVEDAWERRQPRNAIRVDELVATSDAAHAGLWRFLAEMDWVATVRAERRSPSERLPWILANARAATVSDVGDDLWVRIFDVPQALEARTYEREGSLVLEVIDTEAPGGRVHVQLDAGPDGATCRATGRSPDLTLDVSALGAAYLGGTRLRDAVLPTGVDEHRAGALLEAERLFRSLDEPWCTTFF